ncbi:MULTISPECIES: cytochrome C assembly family protein [Chromobacterium]|uniref:Cytochrome c biogenesis protein CcsA n=2 Tax=Chromobacterium TaxID=535 RepID=A0ABS3GPD3_9NEIS|nr:MULTISPECIES: cytochrome c biogenesis protein CcsA [Chromobacterium]AXT48139.1 cytochrome C biogenesis protein [Chromobacterium rhizoryzae]MBK0414880.1 cytochrome c biogenesis protein CcsA [Chromobacterium haemolyticum]MBO0416450.1 cytochrome c biogenesis protein CcsA [Chromobacterium haemolyticum]MBO0499519.1 cytochrome c biogenesis protein CcsA [Chromobacterium haemolyticum]MDH0343950.1 cytochrome c biogenesis protein CcsA [Chromobacterium haemolyticum]
MTSFLLILSIALILSYGVFTWHYFANWRGLACWPRKPRLEHSLLGVLLLLQAIAVLLPLTQGALLSLGVGRALSVMVWIMLLIYWTCSFFYRVEGLQLFMMPLAMAALGFALLFPGQHVVQDLSNPAFVLHILVSLFAYSLFAIGALIAILMLFLEKALHDKRASPLVRQLPPLLSLEKMMFQVIGVGFLLLTVSLLTGVVFSEEVLGHAAALTHKTVFAVLSWLLFGGLLIGRKLQGWRGRVAIRWTLAGFLSLALAYIGSKVVIELILQRG